MDTAIAFEYYTTSSTESARQVQVQNGSTAEWLASWASWTSRSVKASKAARAECRQWHVDA